jgi:hypothetical protein
MINPLKVNPEKKILAELKSLRQEVAELKEMLLPRHTELSKKEQTLKKLLDKTQMS